MRAKNTEESGHFLAWPLGSVILLWVSVLRLLMSILTFGLVGRAEPPWLCPFLVWVHPHQVLKGTTGPVNSSTSDMTHRLPLPWSSFSLPTLLQKRLCGPLVLPPDSFLLETSLQALKAVFRAGHPESTQLYLLVTAFIFTPHRLRQEVSILDLPSLREPVGVSLTGCPSFCPLSCEWRIGRVCLLARTQSHPPTLRNCHALWQRLV